MSIYNLEASPANTKLQGSACSCILSASSGHEVTSPVWTSPIMSCYKSHWTNGADIGIGMDSRTP